MHKWRAYANPNIILSPGHLDAANVISVQSTRDTRTTGFVEHGIEQGRVRSQMPHPRFRLSHPHFPFHGDTVTLTAGHVDVSSVDSGKSSVIARSPAVGSAPKSGTSVNTPPQTSGEACVLGMFQRWNAV